jgi:uncharacterized protein (TIGR02246 family)
MRRLKIEPTIWAKNVMPISKGSEMTKTNVEHELRAIIETRAKAVKAGDVDAMMAALADDVVTFDVVSPLRRDGKAASRERAEAWIASFEGRIDWESSDVVVTSDGDVAFSHALSHVIGKQKTGATVDMWFRTTLGFRRTRDRWLIVHEHSSAPFDPASGQASLGLKP